MNQRIWHKTAIWLSLLAVVSLILVNIADKYAEPREIHVSNQQAWQIAQKIWQNEGQGKTENLVTWNRNEDFPSLGIGHFIWYPENVSHTFQESFPQLLKWIAKTRAIPTWLNRQKTAPWRNRAEFLRQKNSGFAIQLRRFLQETQAEQAQFMVSRLEQALPKILAQAKNPFAKMALRQRFYLVAQQQNGVYALVDYVNFKGEGTNPRERYNGFGWGLAQVLEMMPEHIGDNVMPEFVKAADIVLTRRVENAPRDESRWLKGWRKRLNTYAMSPVL